MHTLAILATLEAKPGKEEALSAFLKLALPLGCARDQDAELVRVQDRALKIWDLRHLSG